MTNCKWARNPVGYIAKYASKGQVGGQFPKGCRTHAGFGLSEIQRSILGWWLLPRRVRAAGHSGHRWVRAEGGGWVSRLTGEYLPPTHVYAGRAAGKLVLVPVAEYVRLPLFSSLSVSEIQRVLKAAVRARPKASDWCCPSPDVPQWLADWVPVNDFR